MNISQRLLILVIVIILAFSGFSYMFFRIKQVETQIYYQSDDLQRAQIIDTIFEMKRDAVMKVIDQYSIWDGAFNFVNKPNHQWANANLKPLLKTFNLDLLQIYDAKANLVYSTGDKRYEDLEDYSFPPEFFRSLKENRRQYFSSTWHQHLMQIGSATIHTSSDSSRSATQNGFFIVGKIWDKPYINEFARSLKYNVKINWALPKVIDTKKTPYNIRIIRTMTNWNQQPTAWMEFLNFNPYIAQLQKTSSRIINDTMLFFFCFLILQFFLLYQWINAPLKQISTALKTNSAKAIQSLSLKQNEFGHIALLVEKFFTQKQNLLNEIDERKRTESKLRDNEEQIRKILLTSPEAILVTDLDCNINIANEEAFDLVKLDSSDDFFARYQSIYELVIPEDITTTKNMVNSLLLENIVKNQEIRFQRSDNTSFPALVSASVIYDSHNIPVKLIFITRDLTDIKAMEIQLRHAQKMESIGTLAGGIAHDFNNIITIIAGYIALAAGKYSGQHEVHDDLEEALKACLRAKSLISKILTFSRKSDKYIKTVVPNDIIEDTISLIRGSTPSHINVTCEFQSNASVLADPTEMQQVLMNLISNSIYAMRTNGGTLTIRTREIPGDRLYHLNNSVMIKNSYLQIIVKDTGGGIPSELIDRIFDPYFTTKSPGEGTGLGLSIVHGIITGYNGFIIVNSQLGKGTSIEIYLPTVAPVQPDTPLEEKDFPFIPARIIFVDDEPALTALFKESLTDEGYDVQAFSNSWEALSCFSARPHDFDLLIADIAMPQLDGIKLTTSIWQFKKIPVILYTGFSDGNIIQQCKNLGIKHLLNKPLLPDELARVVRIVMSGE